MLFLLLLAPLRTSIARPVAAADVDLGEVHFQAHGSKRREVVGHAGDLLLREGLRDVQLEAHTVDGHAVGEQVANHGHRRRSLVRARPGAARDVVVLDWWVEKEWRKSS